MASDLEALLAAASKGPWEAGAHGEPELDSTVFAADSEALAEFYTTSLSTDDGRLPGKANARLAALALTLAREVLGRREVGEAVAGALRSDATEIHGSRHASYSFDNCPTAFCVERRALIDRWAKLHKAEEERDG